MKKHVHWIVGIIFIGLGVAFTWPLLSNLDHLGTRDWDAFHFTTEVALRAFVNYNQFPFWNPYSQGGMPLWGNPQSIYFSLAGLFSSFFGVVIGLKLNLLFHVILGLVGMYWLTLHFGLSLPARLLASAVFVFNGACVMHFQEGHHIYAPFVYYPFILLFFLRSFGEPKYLFIAALFFAMVYFHGGTYVFAFFIILISLLALCISIQRKDFKPALYALLLLGLTFIIEAPKLLPALELMSKFPRHVFAGGAIPFHAFKDIFLNPLPHDTAHFCPDVKMFWWEMGGYIGLIPLILYLGGFLILRQVWIYLAVSIVIFVIVMGNFAPWSLWNILHHVPIFSFMKISTRALLPFIFLLSIIIAYVLDHFYGRLGRKKWAYIACMLLAMYVNADLILKNRPYFNFGINASTVDLTKQVRWGHPIAEIGAFKQDNVSADFKKKHGAYSAMYPKMQENVGTINGYDSIKIVSKVLSFNDSKYKGEHYLLKSNGKLSLVKWTPNRLIFDIDVKDMDMIIINQNFDNNWKSTSGQRTLNYKGLLALPVMPLDNGRVELYYFPKTLIIGLLLWFLVAILIVTYFKLLKKRSC